MKCIIPKNWNPKLSEKPLVAITAYDYCFSRLAQEAGVDMILVGDSAANVVLGMDSTREIGLHIIKEFVAAVRRGAPHTHVIADLPFESMASIEKTVSSAKDLIMAGADAVKLEGFHQEVLENLHQEQIPVMGHLGLLPQTAKSFKMVGKEKSEKDKLLQTAVKMVSLGIYSLVLENTDYSLASQITQTVGVPTIGIGAGPGTSGQILVLHDVLGLYKNPPPPFAKNFSRLAEQASQGLLSYVEEVQNGLFPKEK